MSILVKRSTVIRPAEKTPKKTLWLSRLDMVVCTPCHSPLLYFYTPNKCNNIANASSLPSTIFDVDVLKESLSKALVAFYPLAGQLRFNDSIGRYEIDCNDQGALFIEAETTRTLKELKPLDEFGEHLVPKCDYSKSVDWYPLCMAQLTRFRCGGVCLGIALTHQVADGSSTVHFTNTWARLARGLDIAVAPVHDRVKYLSPRTHPPRRFQFLQHLYFQPPLPPLRLKDSSGKVCEAIECIFKLSKAEIDALKQEAISKDEPSYYKLNTFEILAGHVWRCATKARQLADDQNVRLYITVDARSRLTLPPGYCGNAIFFLNCTVKAKDIKEKSLWYAASKVHETMAVINDVEYLKSAIDYLESQPSFEPFIRNSEMVACPNLSINSWANIPFNEVDFGYGKPQYLQHALDQSEGETIFFPIIADVDRSWSMSIKLFKPHMALFRKYFYATANQDIEGESRLSFKMIPSRI